KREYFYPGKKFWPAYLHAAEIKSGDKKSRRRKIIRHCCQHRIYAKSRFLVHDCRGCFGYLRKQRIVEIFFQNAYAEEHAADKKPFIYLTLSVSEINGQKQNP